MFLDEAKVTLYGGCGGNGCVGWRREKYMPMGGPDGGDGGNGGSVFLTANPNTDTLSDYQSRKKFYATDGKMGGGNDCGGAGGEDITLSVPPGTVVTANGEIVADLKNAGDTVLMATGGRGGFGNAHFKSSTRQRPDFAEKGEPGEIVEVKLELKLVADVGIIGYPNVGKSTLISVISAAKPKIADYPFTTLVPNLGVVQVSDRSYVVCDIPGLIEGAGEGKGLGDKFLKHVERCGTLLHVLDLSRALVDGALAAEKLAEDYRVIRGELKKFAPALCEKRELVVINKADLTSEDLTSFIAKLQEEGIPVWRAISAATTKGTEELKKNLLPIVLEDRAQRTAQENAVSEPALPVIRPKSENTTMGAFAVTVDSEGTVRVTGKRLEQFTAMTNFSSQGALLRFIDVIERVGVKRAIKKVRKDDTIPVFIGKIRVDPFL